MGFEWNFKHRFLHMLGRDALKIKPRNLWHLEIGRFKVQNTFGTVESAGTSNPKPPRRFRRGEQPSLKDPRVLDDGKVEIAPRARVEERRRKGAAPVVEKEREGFTPDPRGIYKKFSPSGVFGPWAGVSGQSGVSGPWAGDSGSPWSWADKEKRGLDLYEFGLDTIDFDERSNGVRQNYLTWDQPTINQ